MFGCQPAIPCPRCQATTALNEERIQSDSPPYFSRILRWYKCEGCTEEYPTCPGCCRGLMLEEPPYIKGANRVLVRCVGGCGFGMWRPIHGAA